MLFDTDVFIWAQRGNRLATEAMAAHEDRLLSVQTMMELLQGAQNRGQQTQIKEFIAEFQFETLPLSEEIGTRALDLVETYGLSCGLRAGDAIIAATALEHRLPLQTGNAKHFRPINGLDLHVFKP